MSLNARERGFGDCRKPNFRRDNIVRINVAGLKLNVHKDLDLTFICFLTELDGLMKGGLDLSADDWGWNFRPIRGREERYKYLMRQKRYAEAEDLLSNHSWGTAVDIDSKTNPMGPKKTTFPVDKTRALCFKYGLSWGYDYKGSRKDAMHFEFLGTNYDARRRKMELSAFLKGLK